MNLIDQAESDLSFTLEDSVNGFGIDFTLVDHEKKEYPLTGQTTDIGFFIDPNTGVGTADRYAEVNFRLSSFVSLGGTQFPDRLESWLVKDVTVNGIKGTEKYSIQTTPIDRRLGVVKIILRIAETKNG